MKTKKLQLKKLTIAQLSAIVGGDGDVETVDICTTVVVDQMPALRTYTCRPQTVAAR
jgi:hypothetical protein